MLKRARSGGTEDKTKEPIRVLVVEDHHNGNLHMPPEIAQSLRRRIGNRESTTWDLHVLEENRRGKNNQDIAVKLRISTATRRHMSVVF